MAAHLDILIPLLLRAQWQQRPLRCRRHRFRQRMHQLCQEQRQSLYGFPCHHQGYLRSICPRRLTCQALGCLRPVEHMTACMSDTTLLMGTAATAAATASRTGAPRHVRLSVLIVPELFLEDMIWNAMLGCIQVIVHTCVVFARKDSLEAMRFDGTFVLRETLMNHTLCPRRLMCWTCQIAILMPDIIESTGLACKLARQPGE